MSHTSNVAVVPGLVRLPTELHLQIMSHLTTGNSSTPRDKHSNYLQEHQELAELALVNKHFATIAQESLYKTISMPQHCASESENGTRLLFFLRTMIDRPDLASHVETVTICAEKGKIVTEGVGDFIASSNHRQILHELIERITALPAKRHECIQALENPSEALLCALIFAALPSLKSIRLGAVTESAAPYTSLMERKLFKKQTFELVMLDGRRLVQGLETTNVTSLTLPDGLITYPKAKLLPTVKTLTLEYDVTDLMRARTLNAFPNVEILIIQLPQWGLWGDRYLDEYYDKSLIQPLLASFPKLRTLEVPFCLATLYVSSEICLRTEELIVHDAIHDTVFRCILAMDDQPLGGTLRYYEFHFSNDEYRELTQEDNAETLMKMREGVEITVKQNGETMQVLRRTG